jgi:hypothetical protein
VALVSRHDSNSQAQTLRAVSKVQGPATGGAVLDVGQAAAFDAVWVTCPSVFYDGKRYRMWYSSVYDSRMGRGGIGLATSPDGIHWTRANNGKPVLTPGLADAFDGGQVMGPEVLFDGEIYRMWYTGMAVQWHSSGLGYYRIGLATSRDGIDWTRANDGRAVLDVGLAGSHDEVQVATPSVVKEFDGYRMWYAAWSPKTEHTVCVARSRDGLRWERENQGRPLVGLSPSYAYGPAVCRIGKQYRLFYMSHLKQSPGLYGALSRDGVNWSMMNDGRPVLLPGVGPDFDEYLVGHPFLLNGQNRLRVWYTGYRREPVGIHGWKLRIGLAEMPSLISW